MVASDGVEEEGDCELGERYYSGVDEERNVEDVNEAGYCDRSAMVWRAGAVREGYCGKAAELLSPLSTQRL